MKTKLLALLLAGVTLLSLFGCAGESLSATETATEEAKSEEQKTEPQKDTVPETVDDGYVIPNDPNAPKKRILFLGGSITAGAGVNNYDYSWAKKTYDAIAPKLYGDNVEMINAAISGTGSLLATYRLEDHVLKYKPDLVFIEFAVNDNSMGKKDPQTIISTMDYLVRALKEANPNVAITFVYTTDTSSNNASDQHHAVAQHYGIPEIDLRAPIMEEIKKGQTWSYYLADSAHPNTRGHGFYADIVSKAVLSDRTRFTTPVKDAEPLATVGFHDPHIVYATDAAIQKNGFSIKEANDRAHLKRLDEMIVHEAAIAEKAGATLTYEFVGDSVAIYHQISNVGGSFSVTIDGENAGSVNCYNQYSGSSNSGEYISRFYKTGLGEGKHTIVITATDGGTKTVAIAGICVG